MCSRICYSCRNPIIINLGQGRDVVRILDARPGPWTGEVLARVVEWQLENPSGKKDECEEWLRGEHAAGRVTVHVKAAAAAHQAQAKRGKGGGPDSSTKKSRKAYDDKLSKS